MITEKQMRHNLHKAWRNADPDFGRDWYDNANAWIEQVAKEYKLSIPSVATVTAHLSPRVHWKRNKNMVIDIIENGSTRGLSKNVEKANLALRMDNPLDSLRGPKVSAFARNLMLDFDPVTIDVWAARIAIPSINSDRFNKTTYNTISDAYRKVARFYGIEPAKLQSILWVNARGKVD